MTPEQAFERDIAISDHEDVLTMLSEAAHDDRHGHEEVYIFDRDHIDAINVQAHGVLTWKGEEYTFQIRDGNMGGTEIRSWNDDKPFERYQPVSYALQPIDKNFSIAKWDLMLRSEEVAKIPGCYAYDMRAQPGVKVRDYWRAKAAKYGLEIVQEDEAKETRARMLKQQNAKRRKKPVKIDDAKIVDLARWMMSR